MKKGITALLVVTIAAFFAVVSIQPVLAGSKTTATGKATTEKAVKAEKAQKININTADAEALTYLKGIGPKLAQRIIDYRSKSGKFKTIEELKNVKGIGDALYSEISSMITVK